MGIGIHFDPPDEEDHGHIGFGSFREDKFPSMPAGIPDCSKEIIKARIEENESLLMYAETHMDTRARIVIKTRLAALRAQL